MPEGILRNAPVYLLAAARCFALIMTLPLFSSQTVNRKVKVALAGFLAVFISPQLSLYAGSFSAYGPFITQEGNFNLVFVLLLLGEGMIGVIIGFYIQIIFAVFSTAGQFFAFQMYNFSYTQKAWQDWFPIPCEKHLRPGSFPALPQGNMPCRSPGCLPRQPVPLKSLEV